MKNYLIFGVLLLILQACKPTEPTSYTLFIQNLQSETDSIDLKIYWQPDKGSSNLIGCQVDLAEHDRLLWSKKIPYQRDSNLYFVHSILLEQLPHFNTKKNCCLYVSLCFEGQVLGSSTNSWNKGSNYAVFNFDSTADSYSLKSNLSSKPPLKMNTWKLLTEDGFTQGFLGLK